MKRSISRALHTTFYVFLYALLPGPCVFSAEAPAPVFIKDATLITVTQGTFEGSILLRDGKIAALGKDIAAPADARVIDGKGKYVMPGLIDPHSHIGVYAYPGVEAHSDGNEATNPVTPEVRAMDSFHVHDPAIPRAWRGGVTTVQVLTGSANCIGGQSAVIKLRYGVPVEEMLIPDALRGIKMAMGENPKRVYGGRNEMPSTRMGAAAVMRQAFADARDYMEKWARYEKGDWEGEPPERNLRHEALADVLKGKLHPNVHGYTVGDLTTLFRISDEFGFKIRATHHSLEAYMMAQEYVKRGIYAVIFADHWGFKHEAYYGIGEAAGILERAGVKVCLHTDHPVIEQRWLIHEAAKAVRYGMSEDAGYKSVTLHVAELLGVDHRAGSLDVGKDADLALWSGPPFEVSSKALLTMIDGEVVWEE